MTLLMMAANDDRKQFTKRSGRRIAKHKAFLLMNELSSSGQQTFGPFSLRLDHLDPQTENIRSPR